MLVQRLLAVSHKILLVFSVLIFLASTSSGQTNLKFERLSIEQGLSQSFVSSILQDDQGFIWIGTNDGLNKYDGYDFTIYRYDPKAKNSMSKGSIFTSFLDSKGNIWIGLENSGLNKYNPKTNTFTSFAFQEGVGNPNNNISGVLSNRNVISIYEDKNGNIWVGTQRGLNKYNPDTNTFASFHFPEGLTSDLDQDQIGAIYQDESGFFWLGSGNGLIWFDPRTQDFVRYLNEDDNVVTAICEGEKGILWIGTGKGLEVYDVEKKQYLDREKLNLPKLIGEQIKSIIKDNQGNFWVAAYGSGLYHYNSKMKQLTNYRNSPTDPRSISSDNVVSLYIDKAETLWIGTTSGINRAYPQSQFFKLQQHDPNIPNTLSSNFVLSFYEDYDHTLWVGTLDTGLNKYDPESKTFKTFHESSEPEIVKALTKYVRAIYRDHEGTLWIGSHYGLVSYDSNGKFTFFSPNQQPPINRQTNVTKIFQTRAGDLYIATESALQKYNYDTREFTLIVRDLVTTTHEDKKGNIWFGTYYDGLFCYNPVTKEMVSYKNDPTISTSLSHNRVTCIYEDSKGNFWVATYGGGLNLFDLQTRTFTAFTEENTRKKLENNEEKFLTANQEGLPNNVIYGILEDSLGNLWLSTNKGIAKFNYQSKTFKNYTAVDGLQSNEFNTGAYFKGNNGEMFFGGVNGFNQFFPENIKDNPYIPPVKVTGFRIFNGPLTSVSDITRLELSYQDNFFSFEFAALNYIRTEKNQYAYKMEGFDKDWIYCGTRRYASYTNLDPGSYIFRVKGSNNDGFWNEEGVAIKITINPPFWRTWWAYGGYLLIVIGGTSLFVRSRVRKIQFQAELREAKLKAIVAEQEAKAAEEIKNKNQQLEKKNGELLELHQRADRIFSALTKVLPGTVLDEKYRLEEQIGLGGFGMVYRATHLAMKKTIAVKVFRPMPGNDSIENLTRFQQEAISACRVNHPNAVSVLDSGISSDGIAYLVMELLTGHTLKTELKKQNKISLKRSLEILLCVCQVLSKAHSLGIIHRDIKPDNIFLHNDEEGEIVKVLDFGIAKLVETTTGDIENLTGTGKLIGTPIYISPERLRRQPYDGRSDIYSLGVIFYEMFSGRPPFLQLPIGLFGDLSLPLNGLQKLKSLYPNIPEDVDEIIEGALARNPEQRLTAKEMAEKIEGVLEKFSNDLKEDIIFKANSVSDALTVEESTNLAPENKKNLKNTSERNWQEIERLFNHLVDLPKEKIEDKLKEICLDPILEKEVKSLLESHLAAEKENFSLSFSEIKNDKNRS